MLAVVLLQVARETNPPLSRTARGVLYCTADDMCVPLTLLFFSPPLRQRSNKGILKSISYTRKDFDKMTFNKHPCILNYSSVHSDSFSTSIIIKSFVGRQTIQPKCPIKRWLKFKQPLSRKI